MKFFDEKSRLLNIGLLIIRIGLGVMFLYHGAPKLFGGPEFWAQIGGSTANFGISFLPAFWGLMAGIAEFGGGVCLILGVFFIPANLLLIGDLIVASSTHFHAGQGLGGASHAIEDAIVFLGLIFTGPGQYTIRTLFAKKK
jgi:putative oxidoreductase